MAVAGAEQGVVVARLAVEVDGDHRGHLTPGRRAPVELGGHQVGVDRPRVGRAVDEHGDGPLVDHGVGRGHEGERRDEHLVARTHPDEAQGQVEGGRPAREGHGLGHPDTGGELGLEGVDVGTERGDPVRVEGIEQHPTLLGPHLGRGQVHAGHGATSWSGERAPTTPAATTRATPPTTSTATASAGDDRRDADHGAHGQDRLGDHVGRGGRWARPAPRHQPVVGVARGPRPAGTVDRAAGAPRRTPPRRPAAPRGRRRPPRPSCGGRGARRCPPGRPARCRAGRPLRRRGRCGPEGG